jgi:hypothetical protein
MSQVQIFEIEEDEDQEEEEYQPIRPKYSTIVIEEEYEDEDEEHQPKGWDNLEDKLFPVQ